MRANSIFFFFLFNIHMWHRGLMQAAQPLAVTYFCVYCWPAARGRRYCGLKCFKLYVLRCLSYSNNNTRQSSLLSPSFFLSPLCLLISCPGAFIMGPLSPVKVGAPGGGGGGWGLTQTDTPPQLCSQNARQSTRPAGPQWWIRVAELRLMTSRTVKRWWCHRGGRWN